MAIFNLLSSFSFLILLILPTHHPSLCSALSNENSTMTVAVLPSPPRMRPLKPEVAAIIASLAAFFSITLLLLYARDCNRSIYYSNTTSPQLRRNSGVNRGVIQSLPLFRFSTQKDGSGGLECTVCLTHFQADELLRLLPKCKHAFHVECVDTWLDGHSTCPLCRYKVDAEDVLLLDMRPRISGKRDSSSSLEIIIENLGRFSLDGWNFQQKTGKPRKDGHRPFKGEHRLRLLEEGRRRWSDAEAELAYLRKDSNRIRGCSGIGVISGKIMAEFESPTRCNDEGKGLGFPNSRSCRAQLELLPILLPLLQLLSKGMQKLKLSSVPNI